MDHSARFPGEDPRQVYTESNSGIISDQDETSPLLVRNVQYPNRVYDKLAVSCLIILLISGIFIGTYLLFLEEYDEGYYELITKTEWTDLHPQGELNQLKLPVKNVSLVELNASKCLNRSLTTAKCLQNLQRKQMDKLDVPDILYNFITDSNGAIYEGRGWTNSTSKNKSTNKVIIVATILDPEGNNQALKVALHNFLEDAVSKHKLHPCYNINTYNSTHLTEVASFIETQRHFC